MVFGCHFGTPRGERLGLEPPRFYPSRPPLRPFREAIPTLPGPRLAPTLQPKALSVGRIFSPARFAPITLDPKKLKAVEALLAGRSRAEAAQAAGVHEATVHRWHALPEFVAAIAGRQDSTLRRTADVLKQRAAAAAERLSTIAVAPKTKAANAITALDKLLTQNLRYHEAVVITEELAALRAKVEALENPAPTESKPNA